VSSFSSLLRAGRYLAGLKGRLGDIDQAQRHSQDAQGAHHQQLAVLEEKLEAMLESQRTHQRELRVLGRMMLPGRELWAGQPPLLDAPHPGAGVFPSSALCRQQDFEEPYFSHWTRKFGLLLNYHRKTWEFVFIAQVLAERGQIGPGARGLGFGVGEEPLPACFAAMGCQIVGTDMAVSDAQSAGWISTNEHAAGKAAMRRPAICPDDLFEANVDFRTCDMNAIPEDLKDFSFCWSACALEHLGSIEKGLQFILNSTDCLRPDGWAIHTTEFNLDSDADTVDNAQTVLFRRRDFDELAARLAEKNCHMMTVNYDPGTGAIDKYIDMPPYLAEPHLKLALEGYATTSIGLIIHKKP
jgi:SAM-dependent methyltransferase